MTKKRISQDYESYQMTLLEREKERKLRGETYPDGSSVFDFHRPIEKKLHLVPDKSVALATFKPDLSSPLTYYAHPITLRALKKDILIGGDDIDFTAIPYRCLSCKKELDLQFWHFCPFCETPFSLD